MANITLNDMKDKLLTIDQVLERLSSFEPFSTVPVERGSRLNFEVSPEWALNIDTLADTEPVEVTATTAEGTEVQLTKEAFLQIASQGGLPASTVKRAPYDATQGFLNRVYRDSPKDLKIIRVGDIGAAFAPSTIVPFSNVQLVESVVAAIKSRFGQDTEVLADYKMQNTLARMDVRLIVGDRLTVIRDTDMPDVPPESNDYWTSGVHLSNSLVGATQTFVDSYLFRWWCTNGCTTQNTTIGHWDRRRSDNDPEEVYEWARRAVNSVFEGMDARFDQIQALNDIPITDANLVVDDLFSRYNLPARQRTHIMERVTQQRHLTMYSLMQAVTSAANDPELAPAPKDVERLLRIGGVLYGDATLNPKNARIWSAGHFAKPGTPNPFELR